MKKNQNARENVKKTISNMRYVYEFNFLSYYLLTFLLIKI